MNVQVTADIREVRGMFRGIRKRALPLAVPRALNRATQQARTATVKDVAREMGIKQKIVKERVRFQKRDKATRQRWTAVTFVVITDIPARKLGTPRQTKKGGKAGKHLYPGSFVARGRYEGAFKSTGGLAIFRRRGKKRLPIAEVKVPVERIVVKHTPRNLETVGRPVFKRRLEHELKRQFQLRGYA